MVDVPDFLLNLKYLEYSRSTYIYIQAKIPNMPVLQTVYFNGLKCNVMMSFQMFLPMGSTTLNTTSEKLSTVLAFRLIASSTGPEM